MKLTFEFYVHSDSIPYLKTELNDKMVILEDEFDTCKIQVTVTNQNDIYCIFSAGTRYGLNKLSQ